MYDNKEHRLVPWVSALLVGSDPPVGGDGSACAGSLVETECDGSADSHGGIIISSSSINNSCTSI